MMTFNGTGCVINYNTDLSGNVVIKSTDSEDCIEIPGSDMLDFVIEYMTNETIKLFDNINQSRVKNH